MRCKGCGKTAKHVKYDHWKLRQLCAMCAHGGRGPINKIRMKEFYQKN